MTRGVSVSADQCAEWRRKVRNGRFQKWLAENDGVSPQTVRYHVKGQCSCITDVSPVDGDDST